MVVDYFPAQRSTLALSIIATGSQLGYSFMYLEINMITRAGWRLIFIIVGGISGAIGLILLAGVKDPTRGAFSYNFKPMRTKGRDLLLAYFRVL